jgi:sugar transferase (PEP-CTERM system associated)
MSKNHVRILYLLIFEGLLIYTCGLLAIYLRFGEDAAEALITRHGRLKLLLLMVVVQGAFYLLDLYNVGLIRQRTALSIRICQALGLAAIALAVIFYALPQMMLGRGVFLVSLLLMLTIMSGWRLMVMWVLGHPRMVERVLILGTEPGAVELAREVLARREAGYQVVGFVGDDPRLVGQSLINPSVIGLTSELEELVRRYRADRIVVAIDDRRGRLPLDSLLRLKLRGDAAVEEASSFYERLTGKIRTEQLRPSWLIFTDNLRRMHLYRRGRRLADIILSLLGLILTLPVMALTAMAIKLDSRGPIFYTQERVGLHNQIFRIIKLRSMYPNAEQNGPVWAGQLDPRVTRVGRIIRKLRVDEFPQFINVLRGEMSFIGPRPERPVFVAQLERQIPYYSQRHLVKPGLTGWAQVCYPYGASVEDAIEKLQFDLYYIKNHSPVLDAIILFETARIILFGKFAR